MAPPSRKQIISYARYVAREVGVPEATLVGLLAHESINFDPDVVAGRRLSPAGAIGVGQLMPGTARGLGVDPYNWQQNIRGSARYLRQQLDRFGRTDLALSAYNSGPGGAEAKGRVEGFTETQNYVKRVLALEKKYRELGFSFESGPMAKAVNERDVQVTGEMIDAKFPASESYLRALESAGAGGMMLANQVRNRPSLPVFKAPPPTPSPGGVETGLPQAGSGGGDPGGFDQNFSSRLNAFIQASGGKISIGSGYRSTAEQQVLWDAAVKKYGSPEAARKWVAPPGRSNHNRGIAADLRFADAQAKAWAHANAKRYGLYFPMSWEDWHTEPIGSRR